MIIPVQKSFLRKNRSGNIVKIVREHYLRDDIGCGYIPCNTCAFINQTAILENTKKSLNKAYTNPHFLIVDTNIILHQFDVLEDDAFCNLIILQTVLEEVKRRSSSIYKRLLELISNKDRKFYVFLNEHHKDTYAERMKDESPNDRNDKAIRVATSWYIEHLENIQKGVPVKNKIQIVLLTDDVENKKKATNDGILVSSVEDYVRCMIDSKDLIDKLSSKNVTMDDSDDIFPCHLTPVELHKGIKEGVILQGTFQASRENFLEGYVNVDSFDQSILIQGRSHLNRAVDGDVVAIKLMPEEKWSAPSQLILQEDEINDEEEEDIAEESVVVAGDSIERRATGQIVGIIKRNWKQYCGIIQEASIKGGVKQLFVPANKKIPKIRIETRQMNKLVSKRIIVAIDAWPRNSRYPLGHYVSVLGDIGDKETDDKVLLLEHGISHSKFSPLVLSYLPSTPWTVKEEDLANRKDLRHLAIYSVDPPGCTDIDDALHCVLLPNGNFEVGVHIADVSHFIKPGTAIDDEAASRATTIYLVNKRIDMVPDVLSSDICSLREMQDRLAFSCVWEMTPQAHIVKTEFTKSIIKSRHAYTYEHAQLLIDDKTLSNDVSVSLRNLNELAKILRSRRIENGALVLASPEVRFHVDSETHDPIDVEAKKIRDTNSMVEEFMLLANISVANKIYKEFSDCAVLRKHPEPPASNFEVLIKAAKHLGYDIDVSSSKALAKSLDTVEGNDGYVNTLLRIVGTRCMLQAVYFASGMNQESEFKHYGLAVPIYTHFTSPIRRYADIMVHRLLAACIGADSICPKLLDKSVTHQLCTNLNYRNRMAQYAGRASVALHTHMYFRNKVQDEDGYILYVRKNALQIIIPKYGLEGTLYLCKSGKNSQPSIFKYDEKMQTQTTGDVVLRTFDKVVVQISLDSTSIQHEKLVFKLVKPVIEGFTVPSIVMGKRENPENDKNVKKLKK